MTTAMIDAPVGELLAPDKTPAALFQRGGLDDILARIHAEVESHEPDISTEKGRKEIASLARKVASAKVRLDDLGKNLVAEIKQQSLVIDVQRKLMRDDLDKLRDATRKPLTDWENAEAERVEGHEQALRDLAELANPPMGCDAAEVGRRLDQVDSFSSRDWQEFGRRFELAHQSATTFLAKLWEQTKQQEEERVEFLRLKQQEDERQQRERDERLRTEAAERATAEAERKAGAERAASAEAQRLAEERARQAEEATRAAEARAARDAADAVAREQARVAEAARLEADATAKREASRKHVGKVNTAICSALINACPGLSEDAAKVIVTAIAQGLVPNVKVSY